MRDYERSWKVGNERNLRRENCENDGKKEELKIRSDGREYW